MKKQGCSSVFLLLCILFHFLSAETQICRPSGRIRGKNPPPAQYNQENDSIVVKMASGGDGGAPSECDNQYHSDDDPVVALSTGWFNHKMRCLMTIGVRWISTGLIL
ncbi:hypothetical protein PTKIN_Ptkin12aG0183600 [Pterospermum kingtungense]